MAKQARTARRGQDVAKKQAEPGGGSAIAPRDRSAVQGLPSPFAFMRRFAEEMDDLLQDFRVGASSLFPRLEAPWESREAREAAWAPSIEVLERGPNLVVRAELPGLTKNDVKLEVRDDALCIRGERRQEREEKRRGFYRSERTYGSFYREIPLPDGIDPEQAKATFRNGVLEVTMPAPPRPAKGRAVTIEEA